MSLAIAVPLTGDEDQVVSTTTVEFAGATVHSVGGAAVVRVWDNATEASGTVLAVFDLTAPGDEGCFVDLVYPKAKRAANGIFVEIESGAVEGSLVVA